MNQARDADNEETDKIFIMWLYPAGFISEEKRAEVLAEKRFRSRFDYTCMRFAIQWKNGEISALKERIRELENAAASRPDCSYCDS